jgi:polysaccharide biosynthesis/export protein
MRLLRDKYPPYASALCGLALILILAGCNTGNLSAAPPESAAPSATVASTNPPVNGALRVGDRVVVELTGNPEVIQPVGQEIASDGTIKLPFIGKVLAAGKTPAQLQIDIQDLYIPKYYKHVNVTVTPPLRFFSVGGQVEKGDRFPYTAPITVSAAIQAAGGFNPYANKKKVQLTRPDGTIIIINCIDVLKHPDRDPPVYPGDKIDVPRRYW